MIRGHIRKRIWIAMFTLPSIAICTLLSLIVYSYLLDDFDTAVILGMLLLSILLFVISIFNIGSYISVLYQNRINSTKEEYSNLAKFVILDSHKIRPVAKKKRRKNSPEAP
jgi:hypothetical protein